MRAIVIDPYRRTISEAAVDEKNVYGACKALVFEGGRPGHLHMTMISPDVAMWVDEEGFLTDWDEQAFFCFNAAPSSHFAGRTVLTGGDSGVGETLDLPTRIDVHYLLTQIHWVPRQDVRCPKRQATIVGADGTECSEGGEFWTYEKQPLKGDYDQA